MKVKIHNMKKIIPIILSSFLIVNVAFAVDITPINLKPSLFERVSVKIKTCKLRIPCYFRENLGTSITTITGSDTVQNALKVTTNNNFTALNAGKVETSTSTMFLLSSAPNLATVGTIGTGVWEGTEIGAAYGGRGTTSQSEFRVVLGGGASGLSIATSTGVAGQFLTSNGEGTNPSWQTSAIDTSLNYTWTGQNLFLGNNVGIATATPAVTLSVQGDGLFSGTLSAGNLIATNTLKVGGTLFTSKSLDITFGATSTPPALTYTQTIPHGLGRVPERVKFEWWSSVCESGGEIWDNSGISYASSTMGIGTFAKSINATSTLATRQINSSTTPVMFSLSPDNDAVRWQAMLTTLDDTNIVLEHVVNTDCTGVDYSNEFIWEAQ